jgi:hypothetical protein
LGEGGDSDDKAHSLPISGGSDERAERCSLVDFLLYANCVSNLRHFEYYERILISTTVCMVFGQDGRCFALLRYCMFELRENDKKDPERT